MLADDPDARPLSGGATLVAMMNAGVIEPLALVNLGRIDELQGIRALADGRVRIGAYTRHRETAECAALARHGRRRAPRRGTDRQRDCAQHGNDGRLDLLRRSRTRLSAGDRRRRRRRSRSPVRRAGAPWRARVLRRLVHDRARAGRNRHRRAPAAAGRGRRRLRKARARRPATTPPRQPPSRWPPAARRAPSIGCCGRRRSPTTRPTPCCRPTAATPPSPAPAPCSRHAPIRSTTSAVAPATVAC